MGGDFNNIRDNSEKKEERLRQERSLMDFRNFISAMGMGEVKFRGDGYIWANNRESEGFIQERLDRFFGSTEWLVHFDKTSVQHILRQASDHAMLLLNTKPLRNKTKSRFIFEEKWTKMQKTTKLIKEVWEQQIHGSRMFKLQQKLKSCKHSLIKQRKKRKKELKSGNLANSE